MGDSETVVAATSSVVGYASAGYNSIGYIDASSNAVPRVGAFATEARGDLAASAASTQSGTSILGDGSVYNMDPNSVLQDSQVNPAYVTNLAVGATETAENVAALENASSQAVDYNPSVNGDIVSETGNVTSVENGNASVVSFSVCVAPATSSEEEERLWSIVRANSSDFSAWIALIEETERIAEDNMLKIRKVYDAFLAEFPLCYGYWKKYADHEARLGNMDKVVEVYERGVQGVTYSVDIWSHYCIFAIGTYGDPDTVRRLFERGLAYVGTDYLSSPLWDKYIEYVYMHESWGQLAVIYTRILENPIQQLDKYLSGFKELAASRPLSELRTAEEAALADALSKAGNQGNEGEVDPDAGEQSTKPVNAGLTEAEELEKYIAIREEMYRKAKEFESKIIGFETAIKRPYFHVRPLNVVELENWHNYLDFIEREDDFNKVVKLYERCLIACANYPEYWIRYILCMESSGSMDLAENALARATQVFVKRQPEIHLFAARFREQNADIPGARAAYQLVHSEISPGLMEAIIKHANMEHRLGNLEDSFSLYEQAIAIEKGKEQSQILPMLYAQYSRFQYLVAGNAERAREILFEALEHVHLTKQFLEALIHFESIGSTSREINYLDSLVEKFIMPNSDNPSAVSAAEREELSSIFIEFLGLFGEAQSIKKAEDRHAKLFLPHRSMSEFRKRHAEDFLTSEKAKIAKSYSGAPSPGQSLMGAYPSAQNQWPAGYNLQTQTWPPVTQAQAQQWTPGYNQAGYSAYSGYGSSYTTPQASTSVPQSAAYGAYPPTYPGQQAFPQQSYVQPTAAATIAPAQLPASAPQAYYGSYY
ncbi:hypothetical protein CFOL_v3_00211 [Cephalotus follicularis]|uniref:Uncharacterized protein n=1 Tax=Cephalotus follicularis TaxID=3775 RepID=A0A1Q3ALQ2_CEPFO|nr:hypothetical protein CFOL_v3_00211 [Cephalotus follicularis]